MTECNKGCGDCCRRIHVGAYNGVSALDRSRQALAEVVTIDSEYVRDRRYDAQFMLDHWTITDERFDDDGLLTGHIYSCDVFDGENGLCLAHDSRPPICSNYPHYQNADWSTLTKAPSIPTRCSFWVDVPLQLRPPEVQAILDSSI